MYNLYHIKGVKWGCTKRSVKRRVWEQGYSIDDVCEIIEIKDLKEASNMEDNLNIKFGYKRDPNKYNERDYSYLASLSPLTKKDKSKGGKTAGKNKVNSGLWKEIQKISNKKLKKPVLQLDLNGNIIKEYPSRREAEYKTGIQIHHCLQKRCKTSGGFIWKFKS
jgi:hypothetical protein